MFCIRDEGEETRFGFNFYPLSSMSSFGFVFRFAEGKMISIRYAKATKRWYFRRVWLSEQQVEENRKIITGETVK